MTIDSFAVTKVAIFDGENSKVRIPSSQNTGSVQLNIAPHPRARVVSSGIPLANNSTSTTDELQLKNELGAEVPAQFDILSTWPNGSIKSVLVTARVTPDATNTKIYSLEYGFGVNHATYASNLGYTQTATEITITTGKSKIVLDKVTGLLKQGFADTAGDQSYSKQVLGQAYITSKDGLDGTVYTSSNETAASIDILRSGPFQIMVRVVGRLKTAGAAEYTQYRIWYRFYKDSENFDIDYTMVDDEDCDNPSPNYSIGAYETMRFSAENLHIVFPHLITSSPKYIFGGENTNSTGDLTGEVYIHQYGFLSVNRYGVITLDSTQTDLFAERVDKSGSGLLYNGVQSGEKAKGFCTVHDSNSGVSAIYKNFWQEWPNELSIDASNLTIGCHPQRYTDNEGGVRNQYNIVDNIWVRPTTIYHQQHGMARTIEVTICIHSTLPDAAEVEDIRNDRQQYLPHLQCTTDHYCSSKVYGDLVPKNADSALYDDSLLQNQFLYPQQEYNFREGAHFWRYYGCRFRVRAVQGYLPSYNGSHLSEFSQWVNWVRGGDQEWYDHGYKGTKVFADLIVNHSRVINYYSQYDPTPAGACRAGKHEALDCNWPTDLDSHLHQSCMYQIYLLTGNERFKEVLTEMSEYQTFSVRYKYPLPRPVEWNSGKNLSEGQRIFVEIERDVCWNLDVMNKYVQCTADADYHNTWCKRFVEFMIEWWQLKQDHISDGVAISFCDWEAGTGYWLTDGSDNDPGKDSNFGCPWIAPHLVTALLEWYDNELLFGNASGIDLQVFRHMLYQAVQYHNVWGWNESLYSYVHVVNQPSVGNTDAERQWLGPMSRVYLMLKEDIALGNISNPEWYDYDKWKERLLFFYDKYKNTNNQQYSQGFYGYESLYPGTCWTYVPQIQAEV
jgi:hypothetical protein